MDLIKLISETVKESIETPMIGININDRGQSFTGQILDGVKEIETRNSNVFRKIIGQRVGIIKTGGIKPKLVGYAKIENDPIVYDNEESFRKDFEKHRVEAGSKFDITKSKRGRKYGYRLTNVEKVDPPRDINMLRLADRDGQIQKGGGRSWRWFVPI